MAISVWVLWFMLLYHFADMSMPGTALTLPPGVMLAMPASSVQRNRMDLKALKEQLQKLVPGAHLTLTHHPTEVGHTPPTLSCHLSHTVW